MKKNFFISFSVVLFALGVNASAFADNRSGGADISALTIRNESPAPSTRHVSQDARKQVEAEVSEPSQTTLTTSSANVPDTTTLSKSATVELNDTLELAQNAPIVITEEEAATRKVPASRVSAWLEMRANEEASLSAANSGQGSPALPEEEMEVAGGGWCDKCGCWTHHGLDPNGTPQSEIGHPYVCGGGHDGTTCWTHYFETRRSS